MEFICFCYVPGRAKNQYTFLAGRWAGQERVLISFRMAGRPEACTYFFARSAGQERVPIFFARPAGQGHVLISFHAGGRPGACTDFFRAGGRPGACTDFFRFQRSKNQYMGVY